MLLLGRRDLITDLFSRPKPAYAFRLSRGIATIEKCQEKLRLDGIQNLGDLVRYKTTS